MPSVLGNVLISMAAIRFSKYHPLIPNGGFMYLQSNKFAPGQKVYISVLPPVVNGIKLSVSLSTISV